MNLKIDAERAEEAILQGGQQTLKTQAPTISLEAGDDDSDLERTRRMIKWLNDLGFQAFEISPDGTLVPHNTKARYFYENLIFKKN